MSLVHRLEPLWWFLFGGGGFVAGFTLPALILGVFVLAPLGFIDLPYERTLRMVASPVGRIFSIAVITLTLWHCAHHLRHFALDLGMKGQAPALASYGFALVGTIAAFALTLAL